MFFTRISKQLNASNWKPVVLEFVIVVIGVFIGIQAANWNEMRADQNREKVYLARLDADFDVITARLESGKQVFRESAEGIQLLINARLIHEGKKSGQIPDDATLMAALDGMGSGRVPSGASATFEEMVSSGDLKILSNAELRNVLFEYDEFSGITRDAWRTLRDEYLVSRSHLAGIVISEVDFSRESREIVAPSVFDRERFLTQPELTGHLSDIMAVQVNQYELVARQFELAQEIEALVLSERALKR